MVEDFNKESDCIIIIHSNTHLIYLVETPFYLKDEHGDTTLFRNKQLNKYSVKFIISVLNKTMENKFDYTMKATKEKLKELFIKLPIDLSGEPHYKYME